MMSRKTIAALLACAALGALIVWICCRSISAQQSIAQTPDANSAAEARATKDLHDLQNEVNMIKAHEGK